MIKVSLRTNIDRAQVVSEQTGKLVREGIKSSTRRSENEERIRETSLMVEAAHRRHDEGRVAEILMCVLLMAMSAIAVANLDGR
jgi:hypothetical protein